MDAQTMQAAAQLRTGAQVLVDQLLVHDVNHIFTVPGESFLQVLDALHDTVVNLTVCRQEGGAAIMAEAHAKLTGHPGVCFVTRGPGAANAMAGVHVAAQDSTPMLLFVGQVSRGVRGREAFQELDYRAVFGSLCKWVVEIDDAQRIPELISRAFACAASGRPGPVVVALPEDMLDDVVTVGDRGPVPPIEQCPGQDALAELDRLLGESRQPLAILGGSRWTPLAADLFGRFATLQDIPVACSFRRQHLFPNAHPCYAGDFGFGPNPKLLERLRVADLVLLFGGRMSEVPSQDYKLICADDTVRRFVHVHVDPHELGKVFPSRLAINASPQGFAMALGALSVPTKSRKWWREGAHADYLDWSDPSAIENPGRLQLGQLMTSLSARVPVDSIMCNGAGNFAIWLQRFWRYGGLGTQLAPTSGSMGYGLPAAVAACRAQRSRRVVVFAGDGDFLMHGQEFATAVQYELPIIVVVLDNGMYGTIRMHQEKRFPGRVCGTKLQNPDFAVLARSFGGHGERVESADDFDAAIARALQNQGPTLIHCVVDPEAISPTATLSGLRRNALDAVAA